MLRGRRPDRPHFFSPAYDGHLSDECPLLGMPASATINNSEYLQPANRLRWPCSSTRHNDRYSAGDRSEHGLPVWEAFDQVGELLPFLKLEERCVVRKLLA